jgi:hypothetical protein
VNWIFSETAEATGIWKTSILKVLSGSEDE